MRHLFASNDGQTMHIHTQHSIHYILQSGIYTTHTKQKNEEWQEIATLSQSLETFKWYLYLNYIRKLNAVGGTAATYRPDKTVAGVLYICMLVKE